MGVKQVYALNHSAVSDPLQFP